MECILKKAKFNLSKLIKLQNKKVLNFFVTNNDKMSENLLIIAADINGLVEQIEMLKFCINFSENDKLTFISDNSDLDINDSDLKLLCQTKNLSYFSKKYDADVVLKDYPAAYDYFLKQTEYFINNIAQLYANQHLETLEELVKLKIIAIKHLCTLEFLINKN